MSVKVTPHSKGGKHVGFKKMVGGRLFHLITGTSEDHRRRAQRIAEALVRRWEPLEAAGQGWTDEAIAAPFKSVGEVPPQERRATGAASHSAEPAHVSVGRGRIRLLHDCVDRFKAAEVRRFESGEIDDDTLFQTLYLADKAKEAMPNIHINALENSHLDDMRQHWTKRPPNKKTGQPIAIDTVKHLIRITKTILKYCRRHEKWTPPEFWEDSFPRMKKKKLLTLKEKAKTKGEKPKFDLDTLQLAWHQAVDDERLHLGLGLFAGHGSEEIATLLKADVVVEKDGVYIDRLRHKTGVYGRWWLPPEVGELLLKAIAKTPENPEGLALLGKRGRPLVHRGDDRRKHKTDVVAAGWNRVRRRCRPYVGRMLPCKYQRKTGSQWVRDRLGLEYSRAFLAQERETVAEEHYNDPTYSKLARAMKAIYAANKKMFQKVNWDEWKVRLKAKQSLAAA